jgi:hypothetical protein
MKAQEILHEYDEKQTTSVSTLSVPSDVMRGCFMCCYGNSSDAQDIGAINNLVSGPSLA